MHDICLYIYYVLYSNRFDIKNQHSPVKSKLILNSWKFNQTYLEMLYHKLEQQIHFNKLVNKQYEYITHRKFYNLIGAKH